MNNFSSSLHTNTTAVIVCFKFFFADSCSKLFFFFSVTAMKMKEKDWNEFILSASFCCCYAV